MRIPEDRTSQLCRPRRCVGNRAGQKARRNESNVSTARDRNDIDLLVEESWITLQETDPSNCGRCDQACSDVSRPICSFDAGAGGVSCRARPVPQQLLQNTLLVQFRYVRTRTQYEVDMNVMKRRAASRRSKEAKQVQGRMSTSYE